MVQQNPWRLDHIRSCCCCCCCCASSLSSWDFFASSYDHKDSPAAVDLLQSHCNTEKKNNKCLLNSFIPLLPLLSLDNSAYNKYHQSPKNTNAVQFPVSYDRFCFFLCSSSKLHSQPGHENQQPKTPLSLVSLVSLVYLSFCLSCVADVFFALVITYTKESQLLCKLRKGKQLRSFTRFPQIAKVVKHTYIHPYMQNQKQKKKH